jgi:hypothetical protein
MSKETENTESWPDLAIGLYDKLTGRNARINYDFNELVIGVPKKAGSKDKTEWTLNGQLSITTSEGK